MKAVKKKTVGVVPIVVICQSMEGQERRKGLALRETVNGKHNNNIIIHEVSSTSLSMTSWFVVYRLDTTSFNGSANKVCYSK